jgi:hypothetical protein
MKKKIFFLVAILILACSLIPTSASANNSESQEINKASIVAHEWLERKALSFPELIDWQGAQVTAPTTLYGFNNQANAYMFTIMNGQIVGHIIVGSASYGFPVFEAGQSPPLTIPDEQNATSIIKQQLKKDIKTTVGKPKKLMYLGFDGIFAVYDLDEQVALNINSKEAFSISKVKNRLPSPAEEYKHSKDSTATVKPSMLLSTANSLTMSYYSSSGRAWCGPCSGVSIGRYYRDVVGYSSLGADYSLYDQYYYDMGTYVNNGVTYNTDYGPGWQDAAEYFGYYNFTFANDWFVTGGDYWNMVSYIDNGWPIAMSAGTWYDDIGGNSTWPPDTAHFIAIKGYEYPHDSTDHAILCTDSYSSDSNLWLDWDSLGSLLFTCVVKD